MRRSRGYALNLYIVSKHQLVVDLGTDLRVQRSSLVPPYYCPHLKCTGTHWTTLLYEDQMLQDVFTVAAPLGR